MKKEKKKKVNKKETSIFDKIYPYCLKLRKTRSPEKVIKFWRFCFSNILKVWSFNKESISFLFEWGANDYNWKDLWLENSKDYSTLTEDELYSCFTSEVNYISDRLSLDRLFRTHWLYNQWRLKIEREVEIETP